MRRFIVDIVNSGLKKTIQAMQFLAFHRAVARSSVSTPTLLSQIKFGLQTGHRNKLLHKT